MPDRPEPERPRRPARPERSGQPGRREPSGQPSRREPSGQLGRSETSLAAASAEAPAPAPALGVPRRYVAGLPRPTPERALVMGVLNVTPDSFSDGGRYLDQKAAIARGLEMVREGADLVDVGGESTRPGAERVSVIEEADRVVPVVRALAAEGVPVSVDTMRAPTAARVIEAGAVAINDVSGGLADSAMLTTVAAAGVAYVCMHWRGHSTEMDDLTRYDDVVLEVEGELARRTAAALEVGIPADRLAIDPGLGFAKTRDQDWTLLAGLERLTRGGFPVVVGGSRKRFVGVLLADPATGQPRAVDERDAAGLAIATLAARAGAWCVRTHVVRPTVDAVTVAARWGRDERRPGVRGSRPGEHSDESHA